MHVNGACLQTVDLVKQFVQGTTQLTVLRGISVSLEQGKTYAITGVSGAGKSTLLQLLAGLDVPSSGKVFYNGTDLQQLSKSGWAHFLNSAIGLVFQTPYTIRELNVIENVMLYGLIAGMPYEECAVRAQELLVTIGLQNKADARPSSLSGGQQQRIAILRALFNKPSFLLADEPTGNLDEETGRTITAFLLECQQQWKMGLIVSTHAMYVASNMETVLRLHNGQLVEN